jgi:hypothetical protein
MLETLILILVALWLLGWYTNTAGVFIHLLFLVALAVFVIRLATGRKVV